MARSRYPNYEAQNVEMFGGFPSVVFEPRVQSDWKGEPGVRVDRRRDPGIALADVAIQELFESGYALTTHDFEGIYEHNGANPKSARTKLISDIRHSRLSTRYDMAIREVEVPIASFFLDARLAYEDTDLSVRIAMK